MFQKKMDKFYLNQLSFQPKKEPFQSKPTNQPKKKTFPGKTKFFGEVITRNFRAMLVMRGDG